MGLHSKDQPRNCDVDNVLCLGMHWQLSCSYTGNDSDSIVLGYMNGKSF